MPRGRFFRRRRIRNRGGRKDTPFLPTVMKIAKRGYQIAKFVKSVINPELKYKDTFGTVVPTNSSSDSCIWLTDIDAGTGPSTRVGYSVLAKLLQIRFSLTMNSSATTSTVRILIFVDTSPSAQTSAPTNGTVIDQQGDPVIGPFNMDTPGRFLRLADKIVSLNTNGGAQKTFKLKYRYKESDSQINHLKWDVTGDAQADKRQNHVYMLVASNQSTNTPSLNYFSRFRYIDN